MILNRRKFLEVLGGIGAICLIPIDKLVKNLPKTKYDYVEPGEFNNGFLLLEEKALIPDFVKIAPSPILGEVENGDLEDARVTDYRGEIKWYMKLDQLRKDLDFPLYTLNFSDDKISYLEGYILRFSGSQEVWEARLDFGYMTSYEVMISISARPKFHKPYPVWPVELFPKKPTDQYITDDEYLLVKPEVINYTPQNGIKITTLNGYTLQWIEDKVLYTLFMEDQNYKDQPEIIGSFLVKF